MNDETYKEIWEEICFILSHTSNKSLSEKEFENQIVRAIEILGWKEYRKEVVRQPFLQIGRQRSLIPDIVIYGEKDKAVLVVEVKKPLHKIPNNGSIGQLKSYMRQLKCEFGWLLANEIAIYYDGVDNPHSEPLLIERVHFDSQSQAGIKFVEVFCKNNFLNNNYKQYLKEKLQHIAKQARIRKLKSTLLSQETKEKLVKFLEREYADYGKDVFAAVIEDLKIDIQEKKGEVLKEFVSSKADSVNNNINLSGSNDSLSSNGAFSGQTFLIEDLEKETLGDEDKPGALQINNERFEVNNWTELSRKFVEWLINNNKLFESHLPLSNHAERDKYFINTEPKHKNVARDATWQEVYWCFVDTKYNADSHKKNILYALKTLGLSSVLDVRISFR